jgi:plastocyanin
MKCARGAGRAVTVELTNTGKAFHEAQLIRLDSGHTRIDGGTRQTTELDLEKPGKYALLYFVSDRKGGPPHVAQGMIAEIAVR